MLSIRSISERPLYSGKIRNAVEVRGLADHILSEWWNYAAWKIERISENKQDDYRKRKKPLIHESGSGLDCFVIQPRSVSAEMNAENQRTIYFPDNQMIHVAVRHT